jgi:putative transposase
MSKQKSDFAPELLDKFLSEYKGAEDWERVEIQLKALKAALVERALHGEMTHHLGYPPGEMGDKVTDNRRNGASCKTLKTEEGEVTVSVPRDREGSFEPVLVKKHQRRLAGFDEQVIALYARGLSMKEIQGYLKEFYGTDVSAELISTVTEAVMEEVKSWQARPLESHYPILYLDALYVKTRDNGHIINKAVYLAIGVDMDGKKEVLGLWMAKTEGAKFWLSIVTELKNRGVEDIFIACCDGLTGLPEAINTVFPQTQVQLCIVHMLRNSLKYVTWKEARIVAQDLKKIYVSPTEEAARSELENFKNRWNSKYPTIAPLWERNWQNVTTFLAYPPYIRKVIYTTNTIEATNRMVRKIIKTKGAFPNDDAALKLIYLALQNANLHAIMPARDWKLALSQFAILFHDRFPA